MMENENRNGKKEWSRPELTVLTRNKPEEAVLASCKGVPGVGASNDNDSCMYDYGDCVNCFEQNVS